MSTSRRVFLKGMMVSAGAVLEGLPAMADPTPAAAPAAVNTQAAQAPTAPSPEFTRGIGIYPGAPDENFDPILVPAPPADRNLALLRPAYHSSAYDYNLTAQLITDGIKHTRMPRWVIVSTNEGILPKEQRESSLDHYASTNVGLRGTSPWVQIQLGGGDSVPDVDRIDLLVTVPDDARPENLSFSVSTSDDGRTWTAAGSVHAPQPASLSLVPPGLAREGELYAPSIRFSSPARVRYYRVECAFASTHEPAREPEWRVIETAFYRGNQRVEIGGPYDFTSAWMSAGLGDEWVYVDLGARCEFHRIVLDWIARPAEASIQVSDDAQSWRTLEALPANNGAHDDIQLAQPAQARYVRIYMTRPTSPAGYILSELEVYGRGGFLAQPKPAPAQKDNRLDLAGGAWRLQRDSEANADGPALSKPGFQDANWIVATVPGTVLSSYYNVGAVPDPNYGENQLYISDTFFYADFWYRTEFASPTVTNGRTAWLNFDGINWKADVFLNGEKLGRIEGGFMRAQFDVTGKLAPSGKNALAVRIEKNATPGSAKQKTWESPGPNGGALGADNPTYHASIGWDWIPTIRGRNIGIWDDVYLTTSGAVTLEDAFVSTTLPLPDTSRADVSIEVDVVNHHPKPVTGTLHGRFGDIDFSQRVTVDASSSKKIKLDPSTHAALRLANPKLWWPVGYGDPHLYDVELTFTEHGGPASDTRKFKAGLRQMTFSEEGGALKLWINGRRVVARGGNWGFGESMLRYRGREYDAAVRYHREMNFTMIRNWVGQIGDEEFYEACDRHGVLVWQDFWLANPYDGPNPDDDDLFLRNARDFLLRIRNHASIGIYCGRNEGYPPKTIDQGVRKMIAELHPGLHYIPSSADDVVSGHGPYMAMPLGYYFGAGADSKLHSEMGMPNIPPIESVRMMMPAKDLWPQGLCWGLHDFCLHGAQGGTSFLSTIQNGYGGTDNVEEWTTLAQILNYEGYRAMFEGQSKYRMGLLLWMSHSCWPSFVWQTYDYYFEPTAAYFGCKKGSEPLHIQWNRLNETIEVVNYSGGSRRGLTAHVEVLRMDGAKVWEKSAQLDSAEDSTSAPIHMEYPSGLIPVHFLKLTLSEGNQVVSTNFYMRALEEGNYRFIRQLPRVRLEAATSTGRQGDLWRLSTTLRNASQSPALMVRLKVVGDRSGERILPAIYGDNYFCLMPGEKVTVETELRHADTRGEQPRMMIGGFNVEEMRS